MFLATCIKKWMLSDGLEIESGTNELASNKSKTVCNHREIKPPRFTPNQKHESINAVCDICVSRWMEIEVGAHVVTDELVSDNSRIVRNLRENKAPKGGNCNQSMLTCFMNYSQVKEARTHKYRVIGVLTFYACFPFAYRQPINLAHSLTRQL